MQINEYVEYSTAILNTIAILGSLLGLKVFFKWLLPKLKTKKQINNLLKIRGCNECPRNEFIDFFNGGYCQWYNPASFGRIDLNNCKCFISKGD